jgi:ABC-2 type transport system ATP-binding protein
MPLPISVGGTKTVNVVELKNLTKDYKVGSLGGGTLRALDHVTLTVGEGELFGLIGPNGAGKTTTLKLLMNLIFPTEGAAVILEKPVGDLEVKAQIGYLPENPYFYDYLTGRELLDYYGQLFGLSRTERKKRVGDLLERVGLSDAADLQLRRYSKGMVQRVGVAQALLNRPRVLFLDEPMSGLDPMGRREMTTLIQELNESGVTILFSSHILPDVEAVCDRVAILNRGKLVKEGRLDEILDVSVRAVELTVDNLTESLAKELEPLTRHIRRLGQRVQLELESENVVDEAIELIRSHDARLISLSPVKQTLEEYFVKKVSSTQE